MIITLKSGPHEGTKMNELVALSKGLIGPGDLSNGGDLKPQEASRIISMIYADPFLSTITTERMSRLTKDVDVLDIMRRQLVRVAQGKEPVDDDLAEAVEHGCKLTATDAQLFATLKLDFLREHQNNPELINLVEAGFKTRLTNDLIDLAWNGIADDGTGATREEKFIRLNKGWCQVLREAPKAPKVDIDPATDGWVTSLTAIMEAAHPKGERDAVFYMNRRDRDAYSFEVNRPVTGQATNVNKPWNSFVGKDIVAHEDIPRGTVIYTPPKNLVMGMSTMMRNDKAYHSRRRALEYSFDMAFDFEVAVKQFAVLGENTV